MMGRWDIQEIAFRGCDLHRVRQMESRDILGIIVAAVGSENLEIRHVYKTK